MFNSLFDFIIYSILILLGLYVLIRILSSGIFRSYFETKRQFEKENKDGKEG